MLVVVAPDKFKGSLTGAQVAAAIEAGVRAAMPEARTLAVPVADGGEGTLAAAAQCGFELHHATVAGPTGEPVRAAFGIRGEVAVVEMAEASGLDRLPGGKDALGATSRGTGELIAAALDAGATQVILGVGGSACTDGGAGMLQGLGARLLDEQGNELPLGGGALGALERVELGALDPRIATTSFTLAADVENPLTGPNGAARVFAPQKGASPEQVPDLDAALGRWAQVLGRGLGADRINALAASAGAGAAGGVGFAAMAVLGATRRRGIDVVLELTGLEEALSGAVAVFTGEGSLDTQSLEGKTPVGVAQLAAAHGIPVYAICGRNQLSAEQATDAGFTAVRSLLELEPDVARCMSEGGPLVQRAATLLAEEFLATHAATA
ncbi:glycerate kinase [Paeniglutamicibacter sp. ABSL32-1]|uniref:glycerate kinase n=1 Tax=Paeniglutamicibacter quisquiliarum TaxID=2849498 RepID=UPI001C2D5936|nr:glycerate kinase [Paeniglutamicibacter quisquiliarum]MBV1781093.1 glycerate kinase [Paeniglutamicibacter quisquiliarum]